MHPVVKRFQQTGSVEDSRHNNRGRQRSSRSSENIEEVQEVIQEVIQETKTGPGAGQNQCQIRLR